MRKILLNGLLLLMMTGVCSVNAALYRGVDADGKVVYSDTPFDNAEKFTPPPISVVDTAKNKTESRAGSENVKQEKTAEFKYRRFDIVSPKNNEAIWNESEITVSLRLEPALNLEKGHSIWLLLNDKPVVKDAEIMSLTVDEIGRGLQTVQAQVRDEAGKIIVRTRTTVFFMQRTSLR